MSESVRLAPDFARPMDFGREPPAVPAVPAIDDQTSVIAATTTWRGDLESTGSLHIHGHIEGAVEAREDIFVAEEAEVDATIHATNITIAGNVRGSVSCGGRLEVSRAAERRRSACSDHRRPRGRTGRGRDRDGHNWRRQRCPAHRAASARGARWRLNPDGYRVCGRPVWARSSMVSRLELTMRDLSTADFDWNGESASSFETASLIDRHSSFDGNFRSQRDLRVEGELKGTVSCDGTLFVAEGAALSANIDAEHVTVAGDLSGEVRCRGRFQILPSGRVRARVSTGSLVIQEGAIYEGQLEMAGLERPVPRPLRGRPAANSVSLEASAGGERPTGNGTTFIRRLGSPEAPWTLPEPDADASVAEENAARKAPPAEIRRQAESRQVYNPCQCWSHRRRVAASPSVE